MELPGIEKTKFDWTNVTDDYKKMQQISGLSAAAGMVIAIFVIFTANIPAENTLNVWYTLGLAGLFTVIYYLFPSIYENRKLQFLPDLVYVMGISSIMLNLGSQGEFFFIFLMLIIAINAFSMTDGLYALSFIEILLSLMLTHAVEGHLGFTHIERSVLFQFYGVITFGIVLRVFAKETVSLRRKQDELSKRTKQLLSEKKEILLLINNISEGLIGIDKNKKITLVNKSALKILGMVGGYKRLLGKDIDDILTLASAEGKVSIIDENIQNKEASLRDDLRLVHHDRTIRLHTNTAPVLDESKNITGYIALFRDITSKTELEEQRAEFNAIASHELRTPLTVIEGFLFYLLDDKSLKYDKKTGEYLQKTYQAAEGLLHLSNDILTVIKADEKQIKVALEKIDIKKIAKEVVKELQPKAEEKKIGLSEKLPKNLPLVTSDEQKVKEVMINLVENAIKFTDKGQIKLEVEEFQDKEIIISVTDTGIGIAKEDLPMIFHKFYRTEDWQTRKTGGTGLGLYIAKSFVERLGGQIGVESEKAKGSKFWFTLPISGKIVKRRKKSDAELNQFIKSL